MTDRQEHAGFLVEHWGRVRPERTTALPESGILPKACVCGHDHHTHRDEHVDYCLECSCQEDWARCQNCGAEANSQASIGVAPKFDACSRACALQLAYAQERKVAA